MIELKQHNLRPYKELCEMLKYTDKCAYVSATGTGKSYVVAKYVEDHGDRRTTLVITPSRAIKRNWGDLIPGVQLTTYQGLILGNRIDIKNISIIICDEMHHLGADQWGKVYNSLVSNFSGIIIGLSATPIRYLDAGRNMAEELFNGNIVKGYDLPDAISTGILPSFTYVTALYNLPSRYKKYKDNSRPDVTQNLLTQLDILNSRYSFEKVLLEQLSGEVHKTAVFVDSIDKISEIRDVCESIFPDASHIDVHSKMSKTEIGEAILTFTNCGKSAFLYTVDILNEGIHISGVDSVVMFRKTRSPIVYLQQLGRALSSDMTGERIKILDFVANHCNLKAYTGMQNSTISWISESISDPERQIVVSDYAILELELLDKLRQVYNGNWLPEEDRILIDNYNFGKGVDLCSKLLPDRSRRSIISHAAILGLAKEKNTSTDELREDIRCYYTQDDGKETLMLLHPDVRWSAICNIANRMGLTRKDASREWTEEEIDYLRRHADMPIDELEETLGRTKQAIYGQRFKLGMKTRKRNGWTEEEDEILRANAAMSNEELSLLLSRHGISSINTRKKKLGISSDARWSSEKITFFCGLYKQGGYKMVSASPEFSHMSKNAIHGAATRYGVTSEASRNVSWTKEEEDLLAQYIRNPDMDIKTFAQNIPSHSYNSVKGKVATMRKKMEKYNTDETK